MNLERFFIIGTSLVLNKIFLFWLVGDNTLMMRTVIFIILILNFMILAKSVDKVIESYEKKRKRKQVSSEECRLAKHG